MLELWFIKMPKLRELPFIICRFIWKARNALIFNDIQIQLHDLCLKIIGLYKDYSRPGSSPKVKRRYEPSFPADVILSFLNGAASAVSSGAGMLIKVSDRIRCAIWMGCGPGKNMRVELLALWGLLRFSQIMDIRISNIYGDSKVVIDWAVKKSIIQVDNLDHWCARIMELCDIFPDTSFSHIYNQFNQEADRLSKKAVNCPEGLLSYEKSLDFFTVEEGSMVVY